ncbi:hypothetical protein COMA1_20530 [Candidatus Nitrospira nitrosa]|uniref:Uncharacterized protein n=1 Tax=Candidatus Nitrospira nitrosa TaxID=1742972 RepID=A0A0S4LH25_9BACT|nr:hypothetical protein COMA1_20530 [Candidatus Nitrospira nitrosa]
MRKIGAHSPDFSKARASLFMRALGENRVRHPSPTPYLKETRTTVFEVDG